MKLCIFINIIPVCEEHISCKYIKHNVIKPESIWTYFVSCITTMIGRRVFFSHFPFSGVDVNRLALW